MAKMNHFEVAYFFKKRYPKGVTKSQRCVSPYTYNETFG